MRDERSNEIGASASGILLKEQSTPRHKDLKAGIWMRAVRRAIKKMSRFMSAATRSYSPLFTDYDGPKLIVYPPPNIGGRTVSDASSSGPGSIPGMECLRSITPLAYLTLPERQQNRIRDLRPKLAQIRGQSRSSTATERPDASGKCGFDAHRARQFRRAVEFGLS